MANIAINSSLTPLQNVLALINAANGLSITPVQVTANTPTAFGPTDGLNTNLTLTAVPNQGLVSSVTITYTRRGLSDSVVSPVFTFTTAVGSSAASIVMGLAAQLGLVESELFLVDPAAPTVPLVGAVSGSQGTLTLKSNVGSLLYADGSAQAITMTWTAPQDLSLAAHTTIMTGFANAAGTL